MRFNDRSFWKRYGEMRELPPKGEPALADSATAAGQDSIHRTDCHASADLSLSRFVPKMSEGIMLDTLHALRRSLEGAILCLQAHVRHCITHRKSHSQDSRPSTRGSAPAARFD